ncbi:RNA polymerase-binding protein DksA [Nitratifractor salsuginis]|uniref:Transcriptional regulator, TraR/DksA family n=1 Tax=Nitratifractor salsuginis (strain DSM 16511 / JCM 12458 / E9I37-1) TaxID=749222 RepID=E6X2P0_NITSE|nr:RNA polymerase-binding protein DksA [Nitratifractor salsuginis]ADV46106.1 transcriptional regulator, TraR/DksA family [Nitratifractor salsuginis DSM 16511]
MLTPEEMKEFERELNARKEQILKNLDEAKNKMTLMQNQEPKDEGDYAALAVEADIDERIIQQQRAELNEIEIALGKIKAGTYGICEMCEEPIGIERLKVKNFARYCIACREIVEREH